MVRNNLTLAAGLALTVLVLVCCLAGQVVSVDAAVAQVGADDMAGRFVAPSLGHPLGLDRNGRDILARLVVSTRAFFGPGLLAALLGTLMGTFLGSVAGLGKGWIKAPVDYLFSVVDTVPRMALILLIALAFGGSMTAVALGVAFSLAPAVGAEIADKVEHFRRQEFVDAARAHGLSWARILVVHILFLNGRHIVLKWAAYIFATVILVETSLSYLGTMEHFVNLGVQEPLPSWGNMLARAKDTLTDQVWPVAFPVMAICLSILAFVLLAEGLGRARLPAKEE